MAARTWFRVGPDGSIAAPPEVWAWVSGKVSQMARRDLANGHEVGRLLEFAQVTAEAAQVGAPTSCDTEVSPPKPASAPPARVELTPREAAMRMNCSEQYVRRLCSQKRIPARRVGQLWLIDAAGIDRQSPRRTA